MYNVCKEDALFVYFIKCFPRFNHSLLCGKWDCRPDYMFKKAAESVKEKKRKIQTTAYCMGYSAMTADSTNSVQ
jgi:hypothetical protein